MTWLPINENYRDVNVENQVNDPDSTLVFYKKLLEIRKEHPALQTGDYQSFTNPPDNCYLFYRELDQERILVAINFGQEARMLEIPELDNAEILLSSTDLIADSNTFPYKLEANQSLLFQL
jgi:glycosidase